LDRRPRAYYIRKGAATLKDDRDLEERVIRDYLVERRAGRDVEATFQEILRGTPELKAWERNRYLGALGERVMEVVRRGDEQGQALRRVAQALRRPEAHEVLIRADLDFDRALRFLRLAEEHGVDYTFVDSPDFVGDIVVAVVSDRALD